jgi:hypothetical protein
MRKNIGLVKAKTASPQSFVTNTGIKIRKKLYKPLQIPLRKVTKKIVLEQYPQLEKDEPYIFISNHGFNEDLNACLASLDRNAFILMGSTDQIEYNRGCYFAWLNGLIYVDRLNKNSRSDAIKKMERLIREKTSVLIFPEGRYNNSENLLCQKLFASPWLLNQSTGAKVVPVSSYTLPELDEIYIRFANPISFTGKDKTASLQELRDIFATMYYEQIFKYSGMTKRDSLNKLGDIHIWWMEQRLQEYLKVNWTRDMWDEELIGYIDKTITEASEVRASFDNIHITTKNAWIMAPILHRRQEDLKYDLLSYLKENWKN